MKVTSICPVFLLKQGSQFLVVISRYAAAINIIEKEGASLADRPQSVVGGGGDSLQKCVNLTGGEWG